MLVLVVLLLFMYQVKVGVQGAEKFGEFEEWFNYRVARAAPDSCADFLGSFIADKTSSEFTKGGRWLVWKFEVCRLYKSLFTVLPLTNLKVAFCFQFV